MGNKETKTAGGGGNKSAYYGSTDAASPAVPDEYDEENNVSTPKISHVHIVQQHHAQQQQNQQRRRQQQHQIHQRHHSLGEDPVFHDAHEQQQEDDDRYDSDYETGGGGSTGTASIVTFARAEGSPEFGRYGHGSSNDEDGGRYNLSRIRSSFLSQRESIRQSLRVVVDRTFSLGGKQCDVRENEGTATVANEVFNLVKNLVGAGALGLPSGIAAFGDAPSALIPATLVILLMGAIFAYYFLLMGRICRITGTTSYREAWQDTVGDVGSGLVPLFTTLMAGLGNLAYSMILADTIRSLLQTAGVELTRTQCLVAVTVFALWPLCNVKKLSFLAPFSLLGMAGMVFTVGAMAWRCFDGTYGPGGAFVDDLPDDMKPSFGTVGAAGALSANVLLLVCMTFQAFFAHYNAPRYYVELKRNTIERFGFVVGMSFGFSALMYVAMAVFGFLTFGANSSGFILNNYSTNDVLATVCRIAIAVALVFTYPLPFIGTRDGILDLLEVPIEKQTSQNLNALTVVILIIITLLAMVFTDLGKVNAVGGALFGTAVVFIFPALMFRDAMHGLGFDASRRDLREAKFAVFLMWAGIALGSMGVVIAFIG